MFAICIGTDRAPKSGSKHALGQPEGNADGQQWSLGGNDDDCGNKRKDTRQCAIARG